MLKRIQVDQLRLGMHLKEFCGSWIDHPFWRTEFVLKDPKDIELILASSVKEVMIDCSKGLDVPISVTAGAGQEEISAPVATQPSVEISPPSPQHASTVPASQELERAALICQRSKAAVVSMFQEARMGRAVDVGGAQQLVEEISASIARNPGAIISLARLKTADDYTYMHSVAVCAMMVALAKQLGLDDTQTRLCGMAGLLHDMGKVAMPINVLNKPGKLTDAEFEVIRSHPAEGYKILTASSAVDAVSLDVVLHHHEKMDGSGYPKGLTGDGISLYAKMAAVCDVYDAITSNRPYKSGWDPAESLRRMAEWSGHFDPKVFQAFVKSMGIYPVGSLVRLKSGRIGVVIEQSPKSLTMPIIKAFFSTKSNMRIVPCVVDLSHPMTQEKIINREDPAQWNFLDLNALWSGLSHLSR
ncbi:HD-GYP domain-containing protein [Rhodoferax fermentans]|uniref:Phosphodiesterase n=1 Tax=Rhodoferax fermentans TaxID=28066 RepID=A0A1T1ANF1_RHOFE|nr:HD-GYP domain-containing protein [Rhodoferax fermentans]MBK1685515.1 HD-GYP domain-containing protein [Rhodoferax fermentans]OOV05639.1 phosphodiesterase [Rhodoferax fermentans]